MCSVDLTGEGSVSDQAGLRPASEGRSSPSGLSVNTIPLDHDIVEQVDVGSCLPVSIDNSMIPLKLGIDDCGGGLLLDQGQGRYIDSDDLIEDDMIFDDFCLSDHYHDEIGGIEINGKKSVIDHSIRYELCPGRCTHILAGCPTQLNRCAFYRELFLGSEEDKNADYLYAGIAQLFRYCGPRL